MRPEFCIIQMFNGIFHVIISNELTHTSAILEHIGIADISGDTHMILDILPAAGWRQARHNDSVVGPASRWSATTTVAASTATATPWAFLKFDFKPVAVKVIAVTASDRVLSVQWIVEFDKSERGTTRLFYVDVADSAVFVENVL